MNFVITFKEFVKNPILGILFLCLGALAYLHIETTNNLKTQIKSLQEQVIELNKKYDDLNSEFISTLKDK
jgi:cell division protein FtsB